ncbi:thiamine pyrophosphate-dependent enzyme [Actinomadura algeriensis]|uniref:Acetolactate synthase-1/2/3 large subunit n=1 Tax=Actinomadura algeriensis TaxID=1679523 RepID=A0ABR9JIN7_9ACTN|nr:thiamine pyrophosphate-dependent enzyme [Actinomadura algeriensis]MBE1530423.1 acetolactate synthase-1/2/3 large subunit [Actinomadura algeriensis]
MTLSGGHALVRSLAAHGVDHVFGIPGMHNLEIYSWLGTYGIAQTAPRHEQGAGYAADAYARTTGRPGVVVTTTGPGLLNAATAAAQAYSDSVPLLLVSPGMPVRHPATGGGRLHETKDQSRALGAIVERSHRATTVAAVETAVARAFGFLTGRERPRPVHIEIPHDVIIERADLGAAPPLARPVPAAAAPRSRIEAAARTLLHGTATIVAGGGSRGAAAEVAALAELLGAPVVTTANGKGVLSERHPLSLGVGLHLPAVRARLETCDVVVAIGTELAEADFWCDPPALANVVRVDLDPGHGGRHVLTGDAAPTVRALIECLPPPGRRARGADVPLVRRARDARAREQGRRWLAGLAAVRAELAADAIITSDSAMACYYGALPNLPIGPEGRYLHPTGYGTLGYALPAAIGAKIAAPGRQVVALSGDGGLQFAVGELATAAGLGLPLPVVVFDNGGYGEIRAEMLARGDVPRGVDHRTPDLPAIAEAYGCAGTVAPDPAALGEALRHALRRPRPTVIVVPEEAP